MKATEEGNAQVVELLLQNDAEVDFLDNVSTALCFCVVTSARWCADQQCGGSIVVVWTVERIFGTIVGIIPWTRIRRRGVAAVRCAGGFAGRCKYSSALRMRCVSVFVETVQRERHPHVLCCTKYVV